LVDLFEFRKKTFIPFIIKRYELYFGCHVLVGDEEKFRTPSYLLCNMC